MVRYKYLYLPVLAGMCLMFLACAPKTREANGVMDNPEHHYLTGVKLMDGGSLKEADREFALALELDPDFGPAWSGRGLVRVMQGDRDGLKQITTGIRKSGGKQEKLWSYTNELRAFLSLGKSGEYSDSGMIRRGKETLDKVKLVDSETGAPYFFMGEIYLQALKFRPAETMYAKVVALDDKYTAKADRRWELVQKAGRAAPQSTVGKEIALVEEINRGDMAALMVRELGVQRFYSRTQKPEKSGFKEPKGLQMKHGDLYEKVKVTDVQDSPMRNDILEVVDMGVKGLQPYPDHTFRPREPMSRAEVAMLYEDIIIRATGDTSLATQYIGDESRFPDVPSSHYAFNAIMLCTTRDLLETDLRKATFEPESTISGVDALLSIKKLREMLSLF
ncbi:MAG: S-layer homology domain-containing protein [Desulfonatronovibrionaceae bacterium]